MKNKKNSCQRTMGGNKFSREEGSDEGKKGNSGEVVI
jgi:hypothetical protein